jgi:hypothetical protein
MKIALKSVIEIESSKPRFDHNKWVLFWQPQKFNAIENPVKTIKA